MSHPLWARLRDARYALPGHIERRVAGPDALAGLRIAQGLARRGLGACLGYFQRGEDSPAAIAEANLAAAKALAGTGAYLSVKAPPMHFDPGLLARVAEAAGPGGIVLDAHAPKDADATLALVEQLGRDYAHTGFALPARWGRSLDDARAFRDSGARIRVVKGEWADADPAADQPSPEAYLTVIEALAGRKAPVAVATHHPWLAEQALRRLLAAGTPCELEQLRGLPRRRTLAVARALGVRTRIYVPFGPGWWPYAVDKALARPYLAGWMLRDALGFVQDAPALTLKALPPPE